jgi:outer membrane autotransporter protein
VFGEIGYGLEFGTVAIEPFVGLAWVNQHTDAFTEVGGPAALAGAATSRSVGYSSVGLRFATVWVTGGGSAIIPRATVAWQHTFGGLAPATALAFQNTGVAFTVAGVPLARDSALVETGFDFVISPSAKFGLFYSGQFADRVHDHAGKGKLTWVF